ncbi:uncharacterized protein [Struthio camelus]|uniref:uncharacterized protein n=1 Tax=Struthio camelus TaxID=8801 RepID=UPI003603B5EC
MHEVHAGVSEPPWTFLWQFPSRCQPCHTANTSSGGHHILITVFTTNLSSLNGKKPHNRAWEALRNRSASNVGPFVQISDSVQLSCVGFALGTGGHEGSSQTASRPGDTGLHRHMLCGVHSWRRWASNAVSNAKILVTDTEIFNLDFCQCCARPAELSGTCGLTHIYKLDSGFRSETRSHWLLLRSTGTTRGSSSLPLTPANVGNLEKTREGG